MKKQSFFLTILFFVTSASSVYAVSPTPAKPSLSPTTKETIDKKLTEQINELKEKIASRVSELNLVERRGVIGIVSETSNNKITMTDIEGKTRFVDVDEITKFSSASNKSFGISDLSKGTRITVLGLYNKQSKRILARFISTTIDPTFLNGAIADIDSKNFFVTIATPDGKKTKLDVQTSSKILTSDKTGVLTKYGFSKLQIGNRIVVVGYPDKKDSSILVVSRLIDLASLPKNPKIMISAPAPTDTDTPTPSVKTKSKVTPTKP